MGSWNGKRCAPPDDADGALNRCIEMHLNDTETDVAKQEQQELGTLVATREEPRAPVERPDGMTMIEFAIQRNVPVEVIERLVALEERTAERRARAAFFEARQAFQAECPPILQTATGHVSNTFAPLDVIARTIRETLAAHGLSYSWDSDVENGTIRVTCRLSHVMGHEETATFVAPVAAKSPSMNEQQKVAAALTYGRRQALVQVLGLTTTDRDDDGGKPPEPLGDGRAADLEALISEVGADRGKFLGWMGVASVAAIPEDRYQEAVAALERKRGTR